MLAKQKATEFLRCLLRFAEEAGIRTLGDVSISFVFLVAEAQREDHIDTPKINFPLRFSATSPRSLDEVDGIMYIGNVNVLLDVSGVSCHGR